ncbi:MAG: response regulator transcription factor [Gammaproteobacteria bacterium]|jgi:FixJ family two-component response regulator
MTDKVYLVDDEPDLRRALERLLQAEGFKVESHASALDFLARLPAEADGCVVMDLAMPGLDGLEAQQRLVTAATRWPIVFLTGHGDIRSSVQAMKAGAIDFLTKPVKAGELLAAVRAGAAQVREAAALRQRFASLTPREREVMRHVIAGRLNKMIAMDLGTTEQTIKVHRSRVMEKLGIRSVAALVSVAQRLGVTPTGTAS